MKYIVLEQHPLSEKQKIENYEIVDIATAKKAIIDSDEDVGIDIEDIDDCDELSIIYAYCQLDADTFTAYSPLAITVENLTQLSLSLRDAIKELTLPELNQLQINTQ
jgi:hypothetical protein